MWYLHYIVWPAGAAKYGCKKTEMTERSKKFLPLQFSLVLFMAVKIISKTLVNLTVKSSLSTSVQRDWPQSCGCSNCSSLTSKWAGAQAHSALSLQNCSCPVPPTHPSAECSGFKSNLKLKMTLERLRGLHSRYSRRDGRRHCDSVNRTQSTKTHLVLRSQASNEVKVHTAVKSVVFSLLRIGQE